MAATELADYIRQQLEKSGMTVAEFARRAKLSRQGVYNILNADFEQARLSTFIQLANALKIHPLDFLRIFFNRWEFPSANTTRTNSLVNGDDVGFICDVTYPDNSILSPGQTFEKIWEIRNVGIVPWVNRRLVCLDEHIEVRFQNGKQWDTYKYGLMPLDGREIFLPIIRPGENNQVNIHFLAPEVACTTISWWKMADVDGNYSFPDMTGLYCLVQVMPL
jgi:transcriptional regulator with XRE-family HTH domain